MGPEPGELSGLIPCRCAAAVAPGVHRATSPARPPAGHHLPELFHRMARRPQPLHFKERVLHLHPHWRFAFSRGRLFLVEYRVNFFDAFVRRKTPYPYVTSEKVAVFVPVQRAGGAFKVDITTFS